MGVRNVLAVCDPESRYVRSFAEYVRRKKNMPFEIQAFTGIEALQEFVTSRRIEILLISDRAMCPQVKEMDIGQIVILSEGMRDRKTEENFPVVYKYQSADAVIREAMNSCGEEQTTVFPTAGKRRMRVIGVYSPVGRTGKTSFALTLGQILAKDCQVLFLNLEEYAGFENLMGCRYEGSTGDLIYYIRQGYKNLALKISGMIQSIGNLDYLPPATSPADIQDTALAEWLRLLEEIEDATPYEAVILDIGDGVSDLCGLLSRCEVIYMPIRSDAISEAKIQQFEQLLTAWDYSELSGRIQKLLLPHQKTDRSGREYLDELLWGQMGEYVRCLIHAGDDNG